MDIRINGIVVGKIENRTYVTWRRPEHFFVKHRGFGISTSIMRTLLKHGVEAVEIRYAGRDRITYLSRTDVWLRHGTKVKEKGHDEQYILPTMMMEAETYK